jgi:hypothetical protein
MSHALHIRAQEIAEQLVGTAKSITEVCTPAEIENVELMAQVDEEITLCDVCGWYVETDDIDDSSGESLCTDCVEAGQ